MTRTDNIKKNMVFSFLKFATQLVLQFILRTVLIYVMGAEYLGLNGLFNNIFTFLNLAELGIGSAIAFSMYKPIAENDIPKIRALQDLYKKFYFIITIIVLSVGLIISPFISFLINGGVTVDINIYVLYFMYLANTLVGYFSAHKRSLLFAYQRNDVENKIRTICLLCMTILQIIVVILFKNYYIYFSINICFVVVECLLIHIWANKLFPDLKVKGEKLDETTRKEINKNIAALSLHQIGGAVVFSTDNILISSILNISTLGAYSNYYLIISSLISLFGVFSTAIIGSVGNLVASSEKDYVYSKYRQINFLFSYLSGFTTICLICLYQPFINMWTGGGVYLLSDFSVVLICLSYYLNRMRLGTNILKETTGLYWQDRWKPILEASINLVVSIILGYLIGLNGIIIGTIVSTLVAPFWVEPYVLYKHYFKRGVADYFKRYVLDFIIMLGACAVCYFVCSLIPDGNIWLLIAKFAACIALSNVLLILAYFKTKEFKDLWKMGKGMLGKIFKKKQVDQSPVEEQKNN